MTQWVWPAVKGGGGDRWWIGKVRTNRERSVRTCSDSFNTYPLPPLMVQHRNCFARNRRMEIAFQTDCHCNWHCHCQICEKNKSRPTALQFKLEAHYVTVPRFFTVQLKRQLKRQVWDRVWDRQYWETGQLQRQSKIISKRKQIPQKTLKYKENTK